jgi:hypothetical protein
MIIRKDQQLIRFKNFWIVLKLLIIYNNCHDNKKISTVNQIPSIELIESDGSVLFLNFWVVEWDSSILNIIPNFENS